MAQEYASPETYGRISRMLLPVMVQVSGGEPLLRPDVFEVIRALRRPGRSPYMVITTNGSLLTRRSYELLREAGLDEISLSLDYPDDRHDGFRRIPGLFRHISDFLGGFGPNEPKPVILSCVIQRDNFRELPRMAELARRWGVRVNFSAYTWLRTNKKEYLVSRDELPELKSIIRSIIEDKKRFGTVRTSHYFFKNMLHFFEHEGVPHCRAGEKFCVVNPNGTLSPCGLVLRDYASAQELKREFVSRNRCVSCYVSSRGGSERPALHLLRDSLMAL